MFCIKCGVELSAGQAVCPLCGTRVMHPDFPPEGDPTYPQKPFASEAYNRRGILFVITVLFLLPLILPVVLELSLQQGITWSGYVAGGVILFYLLIVFPLWFQHVRPQIFLPCDFAAVLLFLLYVDLNTGGGWFLPFAFPVAGALGLLITAIATLTDCLRRGYLYIFGGGLIILGGWCILIEWLIALNFSVTSPVHWSLFSAISLFILGMLLILIAIIKPLRESLRRMFYIGRG